VRSPPASLSTFLWALSHRPASPAPRPTHLWRATSAGLLLFFSCLIYLTFGMASVASLLAHLTDAAPAPASAHQLIDLQLTTIGLEGVAILAAVLAFLLRGDGLTAWGLRVPPVGIRRSLAEYATIAGSGYFGVLGVGSLVVGLAGNALHAERFAYDRPEVPVLLGIADGLIAGIGEELIVLAGVVRGLEWAGVRSPAIAVATSAALRISYHLDYGIRVLPIVGWAVLTVVLYLRTRRVLAFIITHAAFDVLVALLGATRANGYLTLAVLVTLPAALLALPHQLRPADQSSGPRP